jgi:PKHD-type hydroxylase|tara:strand:- start:431 stop:1051 length:621 start_codon:yes stop_codon:yes gene_type:complete
MNYKNSYWYFQKAVPERYCDDIVKLGLTNESQLGTTGAFENLQIDRENIFDLKKQRDSNIVWLRDQWIYNLIIPWVKKANDNAGWNFQLDTAEQCQFTKYNLNQFYDWHCDSFPEPYKSNNEFNGKIRKLSVTLSLSNPNDYEGGELEFCVGGKNPKERRQIEACRGILPKGSLVVFPSFLYHRVQPVTSGKRYSLVIWNCGNPFV